VRRVILRTCDLLIRGSCITRETPVQRPTPGDPPRGGGLCTRCSVGRTCGNHSARGDKRTCSDRGREAHHGAGDDDRARRCRSDDRARRDHRARCCRSHHCAGRCRTAVLGRHHSDPRDLLHEP